MNKPKFVLEHGTAEIRPTKLSRDLLRKILATQRPLFSARMSNPEAVAALRAVVAGNLRPLSSRQLKQVRADLRAATEAGDEQDRQFNPTPNR